MSDHNNNKISSSTHGYTTAAPLDDKQQSMETKNTNERTLTPTNDNANSNAHTETTTALANTLSATLTSGSYKNDELPITTEHHQDVKACSHCHSILESQMLNAKQKE